MELTVRFVSNEGHMPQGEGSHTPVSDNAQDKDLSLKGSTMIRSIRVPAWTTLFCIMAVTACSTGPATPAPAPQLALPDTTTITQTGDLRIGTLDIVTVRVFGVDDLNGSYQVDQQGNVKIPLIGTMMAKGFTALEFAEKLEAELGRAYLQDPDVTISVKEGLSPRVTIEGSVNSPGVYDVNGTISLLQVVAMGGGLSDDANPERVIVFRQIEGQRHAAGYNLKMIRANEAEDPAIYGNDIIVVDGSRARQTYGEVLRSIPLLSLFLIF